MMNDVKSYRQAQILEYFPKELENILCWYKMILHSTKKKK